MKLVERHIIAQNHPLWSEIDHYAFLSKNLFNLANYHYRQYFFENSQKLSFNQLYHLVSKTSDYLALPTKVSKQIIPLLLPLASCLLPLASSGPSNLNYEQLNQKTRSGLD